VTQTPHGRHSDKKLIIYDSGDAYFVNETRLNVQKVGIQDVLPYGFIQELLHHFFDTEASDGETEDG
jgi:hypothetical protein